METYKPKLVVVRGNSGSGKTTIAERLQQEAAHPTAVIGQDNIRRVLLSQTQLAIGDTINLTDQVALFEHTVDFALSHRYNVVLEGIFRFAKFGPMLINLALRHPDNHFYYLDVSFDETLQRHSTKPNAHEFGEAQMREWYEPCDITNFDNEIILPGHFSIDQSIEIIKETSGL